MHFLTVNFEWRVGVSSLATPGERNRSVQQIRSEIQSPHGLGLTHTPTAGVPLAGHDLVDVRRARGQLHEQRIESPRAASTSPSLFLSLSLSTGRFRLSLSSRGGRVLRGARTGRAVREMTVLPPGAIQ